jgi:hypothetical protein
VDAGSVDYEVSHGTELRFSNPSAGDMNIFTALISGQQVSSAAGGAGCYYKKAGGGSTGTSSDGTDGKQTGSGSGGTGGSIDSALVGTWHYSTQEAANNGQYAAFEFTANGSLIIAGQSSGMAITVTTSNGRISATLTQNGDTMNAGSADYTVSGGTTLSFSNPSGGGINIFTVLQQVSSAAGGTGYYYKAGSGGTGNNGGGGTDGTKPGNGETDDKETGTSGNGNKEPEKPVEPDGGENGGPSGNNGDGNGDKEPEKPMEPGGADGGEPGRPGGNEPEPDEPGKPVEQEPEPAEPAEPPKAQPA